MARTIVALLLASAVQFAWEGVHALEPWQHILIDVPVLFVVTAPPRHYWQAVIGGLVLGQIAFHVVWWVCHDATDMARLHWFGCVVLGYAKCVALLFWAGGANVVATAIDRRFGRIARALLEPVARKLAE